MKKTTVIRLLASFIAIITVCGIFIGCADTASGGDTSAPDTSNVPGTSPDVTTVPENTTPTALSVLGKRDFGGDTVTFYSRYYDGVWKSDLVATENDVDTLKVAVYRRNKFIEETYRVKIDEIQSGSASFKPKLENLVATGDDSFDAVYMSVTDAAESAQAGLLWDLHDIERIDLGAKWWSQTCNKSWSIGNRQFFAVGDITTVDNMSARGVFFN